VRKLISNPEKKAYTIIELLTVMTIVVILIGLLVPSVNMVKRFAKKVRQKAQFHGIEVAMELYNNEFEGYPDSDETDKAVPQQQYCGAMKLAEAMVGQDLMGFHPGTQFRADCTDGGTPFEVLYDNPAAPRDITPAELEESKSKRRGPYLQLDNANAYRMRNIYGIEPGDTDPFDPYLFVLCDVYTNVGNQRGLNEKVGKAKIGMPILYYKANPAGKKHPYFDENNIWQGNVKDPENIYDYRDNHELVKLGMPFNPGIQPRLEEDLTVSLPEPEGYRFYIITRNYKIQTRTGMPCHPDSYILISAGFDGEYGTEDDLFNFEP